MAPADTLKKEQYAESGLSGLKERKAVAKIISVYFFATDVLIAKIDRRVKRTYIAGFQCNSNYQLSFIPDLLEVTTCSGTTRLEEKAQTSL
ncbi:MAG: hypothetical protein GY799_03935 [Desulfobulbaceae bacterium]|nr:hypothetical protein [Desulfobulbaceae bacterium]